MQNTVFFVYLDGISALFKAQLLNFGAQNTVGFYWYFPFFA